MKRAATQAEKRDSSSVSERQKVDTNHHNSDS